jgi:hypothetical protein
MSIDAAVLLGAVAVYLLIGVITAIAFVTVGIGAVLPGMPATLGARLLFLPGAAALWPLVLARWCKARR